MPTYEYQCNACKAVYELRQGFDAKTTHKCEECGKGTAKRVLYAPPILFKGSGWYATDNRSKTSVSGESDSKTESGPAEPASETKKAETAPAKKSETKSAASDAAAS